MFCASQDETKKRSVDGRIEVGRCVMPQQVCPAVQMIEPAFINPRLIKQCSNVRQQGFACHELGLQQNDYRYHHDPCSHNKKLKDQRIRQVFWLIWKE